MSFLFLHGIYRQFILVWVARGRRGATNIYLWNGWAITSPWIPWRMIIYIWFDSMWRNLNKQASSLRIYNYDPQIIIRLLCGVVNYQIHLTVPQYLRFVGKVAHTGFIHKSKYRFLWSAFNQFSITLELTSRLLYARPIFNPEEHE